MNSNNSFGEVLPVNFGDFTVRCLSWDDFRGVADSRSKHLAMTFWYVTYSFWVKE